MNLLDVLQYIAKDTKATVYINGLPIYKNMYINEVVNIFSGNDINEYKVYEIKATDFMEMEIYLRG